MLTEERWKMILDILEKEGAVSVQELAMRLDTSAATVRRDLTQLDTMGKLVKVHGGATSVSLQYVTRDMSMEEKYVLHTEEKRAIAEYAAPLIRPNDFVYIDAGTTTEMLVDCIREQNATYITNSLTNARKLVRKGFKTFLTGGEVKGTTEAVVGAEAAEYLRKLHFTIGFWGTNGVSAEDGFTTPDQNEAMMKRISMGQTTKRYILCDRSKFSVVSPVTFADFEDAVVITGKLTDKKYKKYENIMEVTK
jgi:DeoR family fructose operon transcriptional repressor